VNPKILIRVQGPTTGPADDELLEAKELMDLGNLSCLEERGSLPALGVIDGTRQLGRIKLNVLAAGPELVIPELTTRDGGCPTGGFAAGTRRIKRSAWTICGPSRTWPRSPTMPASNSVRAACWTIKDGSPRPARGRWLRWRGSSRGFERRRLASSSNCCLGGKSCDVTEIAPGNRSFDVVDGARWPNVSCSRPRLRERGLR
jgi:hypothetical protein